MPLLAGSVSPSMALAQMAASTQLPPALSMSTPAIVASGWLAHTMPCWHTMVERSRLRAFRRCRSINGPWLSAGVSLPRAPGPMKAMAADVPAVSWRKCLRFMGGFLPFKYG